MKFHKTMVSAAALALALGPASVMAGVDGLSGVEDDSKAQLSATILAQTDEDQGDDEREDGDGMEATDGALELAQADEEGGDEWEEGDDAEATDHTLQLAQADEEGGDEQDKDDEYEAEQDEEESDEGDDW